MIKRISPHGFYYYLSVNMADKNKTDVTTQGKTLTLDMQIDRVTMCWFNWQMKRYLIQDAFPDLPLEQREFLISGVTPEEWNTLFKDETK